MISAMPIHLPTGKCSPKKRNIQRAVKAGRILLNAFACVTPTLRSAKQNNINAITLANTVSYATQPNATKSCDLSIANCKLYIASGPSFQNHKGIKNSRLTHCA